jgi:predicted DsbA family dithiol-disulfide isomerase
MTEEKPRLIIDMVADPVCPWCYVGKRSLDRAAMALSFSHDVVVRYRPYQLAPETPAEGMDRKKRMEEKFPDPAQRAQMAEALKEAARVAGVNFDPALPGILPNTINALRLLRWAHLEGVHQEVAEALFAEYWQRGQDIADIDVLADIAGKAGMDKDAIAEQLCSDEDRKDILEEADAFRQGGVTGVPTFIVNEQAGFAGALPPDQLLNALRQLASETDAGLVN